MRKGVVAKACAKGCILLFVLTLVAEAAPRTPAPLVRTIEFDPRAKAARLAAHELSRLGEAGWEALRKLIGEHDTSAPRAASTFMTALADGPEPQRLRMVAEMYSSLKSPEVRGAAVRAMARDFMAHADVIRDHLAASGMDAAKIWGALLADEISDEHVKELLARSTVDRDVYRVLRAHDVVPDVEKLIPIARVMARNGCATVACNDLAARFAADPDLQMLRAVARVLDGEDADAKRGAHHLLLTISGKRLPPDADIWRSWIDGRTEYERPGPLSPGRIEATVLRGAHHLAQIVAESRSVGIWMNEGTRIGATALAVLALRSAGLPTTHPAIQAAVRNTLLVYGKDGTAGVPNTAATPEVYTLALLAMALESLDRKKYAAQLQAIGDRLARGQAVNGQWTYTARGGTGDQRAYAGDNSNTQYAILGLRAIRRAGVPIQRETWARAASYWRGAVHELGGWHYAHGPRWLFQRRISMTSAGIGSLAICLEALHGEHAAKLIEKSKVIAKAHQYLGKLLLVHGLEEEELYALYGIERAGMLTGVAAYKSKFRHVDWYADGARFLLRTQAENGTWGSVEANSIARGEGYGPAIDTAYAILFLQKATATISKSPARVVEVSIKGERRPTKKKQPAHTLPPVAPPPTPEPQWLLELEAREVFTRTKTATIRGLLDVGATVEVDGAEVPVDDHGRFSAEVTVQDNRKVSVVAERGTWEREEVTVRVVRDVLRPTFERMGGPSRSSGKQTVRFIASEPLSALRSSEFYVPADSNIVDLPIVLSKGKRTISVTAIDRAGNKTTRSFRFEVESRAMVLDGHSAVGVRLKARPKVFTVECWFRADRAPIDVQGMVANTGSSGFGLFWGLESRSISGQVRTGQGTTLTCTVQEPPRLKRWHHVALTYDGKTARIFLDGKPRGEQAGGGYIPSPRQLFVGAAPRANDTAHQFFRGTLDEVRISRIVRYEHEFTPAKRHARDMDTLLLLHCDTDTPCADDSGQDNACRVIGAPVLELTKR